MGLINSRTELTGEVSEAVEVDRFYKGGTIFLETFSKTFNGDEMKCAVSLTEDEAIQIADALYEATWDAPKDPVEPGEGDDSEEPCAGCLLAQARDALRHLDSSRSVSLAITKTEEALMWLGSDEALA